MISRRTSLLALASLAASPVAAQQAPAATSLDGRYTDRGGDMVADTPQDTRQQVDPSTLIFAYTPVEDPAVYRKVWDGFLVHLAKETGKRVQFFAVQNNAAQIEAMRAGRLHVAGFNTGSTPLAVNCSGFVPFAMMASKSGEFGYEMEVIVPSDSPIQKLEDLRGRTLTFSQQTSNSGYKAPVALLQGQFNLREGTDYRSNFSGRHDNSVIGVANRDYEAAAVANSVMRRMIARGTVDGARIRTIYKSDSFPTTAYGIAHNLKPELAEKIRAAFFSFNWEGSALLEEFGKSEPPQEKFIPITYSEQWSVIRQIDQATNVSYACR
ncbi:phosphate/phosphite/phosphonate ABC transporter substrate-binding protein [Teichococcus cervicalis]|jgi:phosphonate transport system substrate-binding protein|uniref:Phosphate/phosphite/phosphonate ABC transporter, periplasmic binding protein n=1 Tax=Pseudoroseomonas cervicalis ATCC 49957 TaxID=525371 RepID=D5RQU9_9PROT|nr:phosphate/phosphite/phosphonate ABC transporter substrate-binding protein [Pseudoroseomonas cervicalis]EFH10349.1 phosphate/phosphite/phosphonate ABC transporter, periplasmic binding protein [Pseudoroseomonas cervicalis ATCC 49957]